LIRRDIGGIIETYLTGTEVGESWEGDCGYTQKNMTDYARLYFTGMLEVVMRGRERYKKIFRSDPRMNYREALHKDGSTTASCLCLEVRDSDTWRLRA